MSSPVPRPCLFRDRTLYVHTWLYMCTVGLPHRFEVSNSYCYFSLCTNATIPTLDDNVFDLIECNALQLCDTTCVRLMRRLIMTIVLQVQNE